MKNYLITGGAGFIGHHLAKNLLDEGNKVLVFDNLIRSEKSRLELLSDYKNFNLVTGNIKNYNELEPHLENINCVYHLAAINGTENFYKIPLEILEVGIFGIINILKASDKHNIDDLIVASSAEVYQNPKTIPTKEEVELVVPDGKNPRYSYGLSKIVTEVYALNYTFKSHTRLKIFRPHNIYGPNMGYKHVIPEFIVNLLKMDNDETFKPKGDLNSTRAFCYIDDLITGLKLLEKHISSHEVFHIGNDEEVTILDVLETTMNLLGSKKTIGKDDKNLHAGSSIRRCPNIEKIKKLGFSPIISLEEGINETIKWYRDNLESDNELA
ncbi:MAG: NAD-dependent epimerase/dehydratase family protein [Gammaproteobacteria bacterium]|nr:NAD-dependent epimerase/dehydratase family protein [Gammaproteobacteria bacterium]